MEPESLLKLINMQDQNWASQDADNQLFRLHCLLIRSPQTKQTIQFIYIVKLSPNHCLVAYNLISAYYTHTPAPLCRISRQEPNTISHLAAYKAILVSFAWAFLPIWLGSCRHGTGRPCKKQRRPTKLVVYLSGEASCSHGAHVSIEHEKPPQSPG